MMRTTLGRAATTLAVRGERDRSAISPNTAPLPSRARGAAVAVRLLANDLELAAGQDERLGAGRALFDDLLALRDRAHLEGADQRAERRAR